jgi:hypothetical protein
VAELREIVGVSRRTVERWRLWWLEEFPRSAFWRWGRAQLAAPVYGQALPLSLLESFHKMTAGERAIDLLRFILPLTTPSAMQEI